MNGYYRHYVLGLLVAIITLSFIDRQLIIVASPLIKVEFSMSDTQLGLLKGFAFALSYGLLGLPLARLADNFSRTAVISTSLGIWSLMTALTGCVSSYVQLLILRFGLGIGEAGASPPAHSMLTSLFAEKKLQLALSIYSLGIPIGNMLAFLVGGAMMSQMGWRFCFVFFGVAGFVLLVIFKLTVEEPRHPSIQSQDEKTDFQSLGESVATLWRIHDFRLLCLGAGCAVFGTFGLMSWVLDLFLRTQSLNLEEISTRLALIYGVGGGVGMLMGGALSTIFSDKYKIAHLTVPGIATLGSVPLVAVAIWTSTEQIAYICLGLAVTFVHCFFGPIYAQAQILSPPRLKAQASAIVILSQVLIGAGLGPLLVGTISDTVDPLIGNETALRVALSLICVMLLAAGVLFLKSARYRQTINNPVQ